MQSVLGTVTSLRFQMPPAGRRPAALQPDISTRRLVVRDATSQPRKGSGAGDAKPRKAAPPKPPSAGAAELPWASASTGPAPSPTPKVAPPEPEGAPAPAPAPKKVRKAASKPVAAADEQQAAVAPQATAATAAEEQEQRPRRHLRKGKQRYNGGEGQEPIAFRAGYEDPAALGWRYTGHDSRITAAYYENDSGIKIDAFYQSGTLKLLHPRPAAPPGGAARKGPPPTTYHNKLSAKQWRDVLRAPPPPPPEDEEDGAEALGEDELPFEFPRGYVDPVDLDWEYVGSEPATRVAFYERREPGGQVLKLQAFYTTATIKLVFARPSKRSPPEHPPVYFRRLRAAAWRQVLADPRAHLDLGYVAEAPPPRRSSSRQ